MSSLSLCEEQPRSSPRLLSEHVPEVKKLTEYSGCVVSRISPVREKNDGGPLQEGRSAPVREEQCDSTAASDDLDRSVPSDRGKKKRKGMAIKLKDEHLDLRCEWRDCDYNTCKLDLFVRHVSLHIPHFMVEVNEDRKGTGFVVFPRSLFASSGTGQCNICSHIPVHSFIYTRCYISV